MSEKVLTKAWKSPRGMCDICGKNPALDWFGDTSVALCDDDYCNRINQSRWQAMIDEINLPEDY